MSTKSNPTGGNNAQQTTSPVPAKARKSFNGQSNGALVWIRPHQHITAVTLIGNDRQDDFQRWGWRSPRLQNKVPNTNIAPAVRVLISLLVGLLLSLHYEVTVTGSVEISIHAGEWMQKSLGMEKNPD